MKVKEKVKRQIGDYVIVEYVLDYLPYSVRLAGDETYISHHDDIQGAIQAIRSYQKYK